MYALIHDHPDCGAIAFLLTRNPEPGTALSSTDVLHANGQPVAYGAPIRCDHCCGMIHPSTRNIRKMI